MKLDAFVAFRWVLSRSVVSDSFRPCELSLPDSPVHGILQARVLEWDAIASCLMQETRVKSLAGEDPLEKGMTTHSSIPA